jgi:hypothetical protein
MIKRNIPVFSAEEYARDMGNSPSVSTGWPTRVGFIGEAGLIENIDTVFEPGLTVKMN